MLDHPQAVILLATRSARLAAEMESNLTGLGGRVWVVTSTEAALEAMVGPMVPSLALIDAGVAEAMAIDRLLATVRASADDRRFPIVLMSDSGAPEWRSRLEERVVEDVFPLSLPAFHWQMRVESVLRVFRQMRELEHLRESTQRNTDPLTGLYNRAALLALLFRETDRVQRMNTPLSLMLLEMDDFGHWQARLGVAAAYNDLLKQAIERVQRLLRSYDLFGRVSGAVFALGLPGCTPVNAVSLAERIRAEVFSVPFPAGGTAIRLAANFGIAPSYGRSPLVVLREAEQALEAARAAGPEAIRTRPQVRMEEFVPA